LLEQSEQKVLVAKKEAVKISRKELAKIEKTSFDRAILRKFTQYFGG
jgi:hypothetical protein